MPFDDGEDFTASAVLRKRLRKAVCLLAMVFGVQHASHDCHARSRRNKLSHQLACQAAIQLRFYADDTGAPTLRSVCRYTYNPDTPLFRFVDERL